MNKLVSLCVNMHYFEQPRIMEQRRNYLTSIMKNSEENHPEIYLDETWANAHDGKDKAWVEKDDITGGTTDGIKWPSGN